MGKHDEFRKRVQGRREALGLTRNALSVLAGLSPNYIWRVEEGVLKGRVEAETVAKIARALQCSPEWLLTGQGEAPADADPSEQYPARARAIEALRYEFNDVAHKLREIRFSWAEALNEDFWIDMARKILRDGAYDPRREVGASVLEDDGEGLPVNRKRKR